MVCLSSTSAHFREFLEDWSTDSVHTRLEAEDTKREKESVTHGELEKDTDFLVGSYLFVERKLTFQRAPADELIRTFPTRLTYSIRYNSKPMTYTFACN